MAGVPLLAVHAHPDDESLWTGGVLARAAAQGIGTAVMTCTSGELADGSSFAAPGTRTGELGAALAELRVGESRMLGYADRALNDVPLDVVVGELAAYISELRPVAVVTYDAFGLSGHPDHIRVHEATLGAVEAAADEWAVEQVWLATVPQELADVLTDAAGEERVRAGAGGPYVAVDVRDWLDVKWRALRSHDSEFARGARVAALDRHPELREVALGTEYFQYLAGPGTESAEGRAVRGLFA
ncbi:PIG-L deacetylase family protein [Streptomyces sp. NPDC059373]